MSGIDWRAIHERLAKAGVVVERDAARNRAILKARARLLAGEEADRDWAAGSIDLIEFFLASERYGFEFEHVREVYPLKEFTPLPGTPAFVSGIVNVRGRIVAVVDLKKFFDLPARGLPDLNRVIVIGNDAMEFGVLADSVFGVRTVPLSSIQPPLPTLSGVRADYLKGVTADRLAVLDAAKLLTDPAMSVNQTFEEPLT